MRPGPALARLTRIRWVMTVFFAVTTAVCLIVLAIIAAHVDTDSRHREIDSNLTSLAGQMTQKVGYYSGAFTYGDFFTDTLSRIPEPYAFVDDGGIVVASPNRAALPSSSITSTLLTEAQTQNAAVFVDGTGPSAQPYRWLAVPVTHNTPGSGIVMIGEPLRTAPAHRTLVLVLIATVIGLVLLASVAGHLLSGRAMRPALLGLMQQEQFLREAAHELRTPLAAMKLIIDEGRANPTDAVAAFDRAADRVEAMTALVSGLLARARLDAGTTELELRLLRLDQLVEVTIGEMSAMPNIEVQTTNCIVLGNRELLAQAIRNLIENSARYGEGGPIRVRVKDRKVIISDSGPGIPVSDRHRVLASGSGLGSGEGTGTGLAIVAWVAQIHRAALALRESATGGLLVELTFPDSASREHTTSSSAHVRSTTVDL